MPEALPARDRARTICSSSRGFLRDKKKQSPRTVYNKFENVMTFLKANRNSWSGRQERLAARIREEEPEMYEQAELDKLFKACDDEERLWFEFFLMTGMREQEVMHTYWTDVNFAAATVRVSHKPDRNWTPKAYKEREIPIPLEAGQETEGLEGECGQDVRSGCSRRPAATRSWTSWTASKWCRACEARSGRLLAAQVPRNICYPVPVGGSRSADCAAVAGAL